jgi:hypothetical protein
VSVIVLRGYKPTRHAGPYDPDWAWLRQYAVAVWPLWDRQESAVENLVTKRRSPVNWTSTGKWRELRDGPAIYCVNDEWIDTGITRFGSVGLFAGPLEQWTLCIRMQCRYNTEGTVIARGGTVTTARTFQIQFNRPTQATRTPLFFVRGATTQADWGLDDDLPHTIWVTWDGAAMMAYYDDAEGAFAVPVGTAVEETSEPIVLGARSGGLSGLDGALHFCAILNIPLNRAKIIDWNRDVYAPWRQPPLQPFPSPIPYQPASSGPPRAPDALQVVSVES